MTKKLTRKSSITTFPVRRAFGKTINDVQRSFGLWEDSSVAASPFFSSSDSELSSLSATCSTPQAVVGAILWTKSH